MWQKTTFFLLLSQAFAKKLDLASMNVDFAELQNAGRMQPAKTGNPQPCECGEMPYVVDFADFSRGDYVDTIVNNTLYVKAIGKGENPYTPDDTGVHNPTGGKARIYDSNLPGPDLDLGSPNLNCPIPGPGKGIAGEPGNPSENCVSLNNLMIIQWKHKVNPDDNVDGGSLVFTLDNNVNMRLNEVGILDTPEGERVDVITSNRYNLETFVTYINGAGANGHQIIRMSELMPIRYHNEFRIDLPGDCGISYLQFCTRDPSFAPPNPPPFDLGLGLGRRLRGAGN